MKNAPNALLSRLNQDVNLSVHTGPAALIVLLEKVALKVALRLNPDPLIKVAINGQCIQLHYSHHLPRTLKANPSYEGELTRLASFLAEESGSLTMIDVGANVGDSVLMMPATLSAEYLCVEPERRYFELLQRNVEGRPNIVVERCIVADRTASFSDASFEVKHGTASLSDAVATSGRGVEKRVPTMTIDELVQKYPVFSHANLLKVDTDGYDYLVLRGSTALLRQAHPVIYVEIATWHWWHVGHALPSEAFEFLSEQGFSDAILYDSSGFLIVSFELRDFRKYAFLFDYALRRGAVAYNAIFFHKDERACFERFLRSELLHFANSPGPT